ncbi:MAG: ABC transporter permease subunit [Candidatus Sungbacteria bacterium]|nr:ABC transporter permease subunit [Candidatus Sungbacteria bacterium]
MRRIPKFFGIHAEPRYTFLLALLPFILLISLYVYSSHERLKENPSDKILPSPAQMAEAVKRMVTTEDPSTDGIHVFGYKITVTYFLGDNLASFKRFYSGVALYAVAGLILGLVLGLFPGLRALFLPFIVAISSVPPIALLPILLMVFGVDDFSKIVLIFLSGFFTITRDIYLAVEKIPKEHITKALTLGASQFQIAYRIVFPQIKPRLIDATRLSLGSSWVYLITAEYIASTQGLGYRIALMRRFLGMDVIIPYVLTITLLAFATDWAMKTFVVRRYAWYARKEE